MGYHIAEQVRELVYACLHPSNAERLHMPHLPYHPLSQSDTVESSTIITLFDWKPGDKPGNNVSAVQLKELYHSMSLLGT